MAETNITPRLTPIPSEDSDVTYRSLPNNMEAEQALLGAILVNNDAASRVTTFLDPEHFFDALHGRIYQAAMTLIDRQQVATPVTLKTYFEQDEAMTELGGTQYLARLAAAAITVINAEDYGRMIYDLALRRELIFIGEDMVNRAYDPEVEDLATAQIEAAEGQLYALAEEGEHEGGFRSFSASLEIAMESAARAYQRDGGLTGVATGLIDFDRILGGLHRSDLIIIAGRPGMGKSSLGTNIAFNAAKARQLALQESPPGTPAADLDGAIVGFFSLEMSAEQLATRMLSEEAEITSEHIRRGDLTEGEFNRVVLASETLQEIQFFIDDTPALTISALRTRARRLKRTQGLSMIVVDYLQLLRPSGRSRLDNRVQEISEISQGLKAIAKELDIPVVALAQLSRAVEQREDKRPQLSDLRESGSIEQDADVVMFIYREDYYLERSQPTEGTPEFIDWQEKMDRVHGIAEILVAKQRHGPTGKIKLSFQGHLTKFSNHVERDHLPETTL